MIVLDGSTRLSYLLLLDGQSFETLAEARLETFIPMSILRYVPSVETNAFMHGATLYLRFLFVL